MHFLYKTPRFKNQKNGSMYGQKPFERLEIGGSSPRRACSCATKRSSILHRVSVRCESLSSRQFGIATKFQLGHHGPTDEPSHLFPIVTSPISSKLDTLRMPECRYQARSESRAVRYLCLVHAEIQSHEIVESCVVNAAVQTSVMPLFPKLAAQPTSIFVSENHKQPTSQAIKTILQFFITRAAAFLASKPPLSSAN